MTVLEGRIQKSGRWWDNLPAIPSPRVVVPQPTTAAPPIPDWVMREQSQPRPRPVLDWLGDFFNRNSLNDLQELPTVRGPRPNTGAADELDNFALRGGQPLFGDQRADDIMPWVILFLIILLVILLIDKPKKGGGGGAKPGGKPKPKPGGPK